MRVALDEQKNFAVHMAAATGVADVNGLIEAAAANQMPAAGSIAIATVTATRVVHEPEPSDAYPPCDEAPSVAQVVQIHAVVGLKMLQNMSSLD